MKFQKLSQLIFPPAGGLIIICVLAGWFLGLPKEILIILPLVSLALLSWSIVIINKAWLITTSLLSGLTSATMIIIWFVISGRVNDQLGIASIAFGVSWIIILVVSIIQWKRIFWWTIIPAGLFISLGLCFINSPAGIWDFVFYCGAGIGLTMLAWGIGAKLFGLIISGSIILTVAPGISFSWKLIGVANAVSQTGVMLVWFGLGWALITICSRAIRDKFIWWPLIPGGILEMVGIGLYLGGNPNITVGFINNSIIMSVLIFGSYIFFLRLNFRK